MTDCGICLGENRDIIKLNCNMHSDATHDLCHECFKETVYTTHKCPYCREAYHPYVVEDIVKRYGIEVSFKDTEEVYLDIVDRIHNNEPFHMELYNDFEVDWTFIADLLRDQVVRLHTIDNKDDEIRRQIRVTSMLAVHIVDMIVNP